MRLNSEAFITLLGGVLYGAVIAGPENADFGSGHFFSFARRISAP
jgi:hypothetical protein